VVGAAAGGVVAAGFGAVVGAALGAALHAAFSPTESNIKLRPAFRKTALRVSMLCTPLSGVANTRIQRRVQQIHE
jgi:hypothetical protein